jgi:anti-sigma regulatory factor (Ser/Thr protein kinase)
LSSQPPVLAAFEAVDELSQRFEDSPVGQFECKSSEFALGPLAEVLVLRRKWRAEGHEVRLRSDGDARHAAIVEVTKKKSRAAAKVEPGVGAFHIAGSGEPLGIATHEFVSATGRLALQAGMPLGASRLLKGAFGELIDNVSEHAGSDARGLAAYELGPRSISVVVADSGRGVVQGYVTSEPELAGLDAMDALKWAVKEHRSRLKEPGRGTGFSTVMRAMRALDAALRVRSDDASIEIEGAGDGATWVLRDQPKLQGFVVSLHLTW